MLAATLAYAVGQAALGSTGASGGEEPKKANSRAIATSATNEPQYATRSLLSRSRVDWAIEAARRVGVEPASRCARRSGRASAAVQAGAPT